MAPKSYDLGYAPFPSVRGFFTSQLAKTVLPPKGTSMAGTTALITGANAGIGYACAEWFLELGVSRLIIAVRTVAKGEAAAVELRKKHKGANIDVWQVDMLKYSSVQEFAARCSGLDRLDVAVLNAGMTSMTFKLGPEGHEELLQVNYLSTVLLATLLLPTLRDRSPPGKPGRLTIVNSGTAMMSKLKTRKSKPFLPTFDDKANFGSASAYADPKALAHFWVLKLVERVSKEDVVVNLVDPGLCKGTLLHRNLNSPARMAFAGIKESMGRTVRAGASTIVDAAVVRGEETHGSYLMDWKIFRYCPLVYGPEGADLADRIWTETLEELSFANLKEVLSSMSR